MANEDHIRFEATFAELDEYTARAKQLLEEQLQRAVALGSEGEKLVSDIRSQLAALEGVAGGGAARGPAEVQRTTEAVRQESEAVQQANRAWMEQAAIMERLEAAQRRQGMYQKWSGAGPTQAEIDARLAAAASQTPSGLYVAEQRGGAYAQLAAQRVKAEEDAAAALARQVELENEAAAAEEKRLAAAREELAIQSAIDERLTQARNIGRLAGAGGFDVSAADRSKLGAVPPGVPADRWTAAERDQANFEASLGRHEGLSTRASASTDQLTSSFTRLGLQENEASNALRRHGALTTEYLQALARGETTVGEFGYQIGATTAKFAGWTAAAAGTYAALGVFSEIGKGALDGSSGVQQLTRTIDNLNRTAASNALQDLSRETNVSMKEASDAAFLYSRTFHDLNDAIIAARSGLSAFKLDNVSLTDSMQLSTSVFQQFGLNAQQQVGLWNMLAAGQREYNARISQTVPMLRTALGAVHTAGGSVDQLVQLGVLANRIYPGMGGQIGTAFARGSTTYTPKNLRDLQSSFGIGLGSEASNWTQLLIHAIEASATMSQHERIRLAGDIFDPRFGSRLAGLFGPEAAATLREITGSGPRAITPQSTQGALQSELQKELGTSRERLSSFTNELQRMGAAVGTSGVLSGFNLGLRAVVGTLDVGRKALDSFAALPGPIKDTEVALAALGATLLFLSRTRFGASFADLTRLSSIPGVGPSEAQRARFDLRVGTRAAQEAIEGEISQSSARLLQLEAQKNTLDRQRVAILQSDATAIEEADALQLKIEALTREQTALQAERNAQLQVQADLTSQQTRLRKSPRRGGFTDEEVQALQNDAMIGTRSAEQAASETERTGGFISRAGAGLKGFGQKLTSFAAMDVDPFTAAMIALPIALDAISSSLQSFDQALQRGRDAMQEPVNNLSAIESQARALQSAARGDQSTLHPQVSGGPLGILQNAYQGLFRDLPGAISGKYQQTQADQIARRAQSQELASIGVFYSNAAKVFDKDAQDLASSARGRAELGRVATQIKGRLNTILSSSGLGEKEITEIRSAFADALQTSMQQRLAQAMQKAKGDPRGLPAYLSDLQGQTAKWMGQQVQAYSDRADAFGLGGGDLTKAVGTYLYLAQAYRNNTDSTSLQAVRTAQQAVVTAVTRNVDVWTKAAEGAGTEGAQSTDLKTALSSIQAGQSAVDQWVKTMTEHYKGNNSVIKAVNDAAQQLRGQFNDQLQTVIQQQLALVKTQTDLQTSKIGGITPEADIARAQSALSGLRQQLDQARASGADYQTIAQLETQINDAQTALLKQITDNARSIVDAQGKLSVSQVTGISPQADLERARLGLQSASSLLQFDRAHGAGQSQILQDQAAVFDAQRTLNQQVQSNAQQLSQDLASFMQAQAGLTESETTDPIAIAKDELAVAIRVLATIKPSDYKTYQEYQTAYLQQLATINNDRKNVTQQIVQTRMDTLKFEVNTQRITDQQYLDGLHQLLKLSKLSQRDRQSILQEIFDVSHQTAVDLNVGNIKMPSIYEVRRALAQGRVRTGAATDVGNVVQSNITNNLHVTVHVNSAKDPHLKTVTDALVKGLAQVNGQATAAGAI